MRADYAGDGRGTTRNGSAPTSTMRSASSSRPTTVPSYFEAGFYADGAVCVNHARLKQNTSLDALAGEAPRLAGRLGPVCTEDFARGAGAILFLRSAP